MLHTYSNQLVQIARVLTPTLKHEGVREISNQAICSNIHTHSEVHIEHTCLFSPPSFPLPSQISMSVRWSPTSASLAPAPTPPAASSAPASRASYSLTTNGAATVREAVNSRPQQTVLMFLNEFDNLILAPLLRWWRRFFVFVFTVHLQ